MTTPTHNRRSLCSLLPASGTDDHRFARWMSSFRNPWSPLPVFGTLEHRLAGWTS
jgi:hypothetical protein